ncbi:hypothetical protein [Amazonocrinis nigriterrae]|uniref:hypothetical protein n=1 Tax=Amazonocrinis nigriterrae TaxID=2840443 RepID=UPI001CED2B30|nr:hypothetical protein [Amazonocrinis nigriterrae]
MASISLFMSMRSPFSKGLLLLVNLFYWIRISDSTREVVNSKLVVSDRRAADNLKLWY